MLRLVAYSSFYCAVSVAINHNGPAIWGGCVTRRSIRVGSWYPAQAGPENCHGARRVWRTFCRHGTNFIAYWRGRDTSLIEATNFVPVYKVGCGHLRSVAVQTVSEPEICHGTENLIAFRCACPGARTITKLSRGQELSKKCDKQLTHIVRVMVSCYLFYICLFFN